MELYKNNCCQPSSLPPVTLFLNNACNEFEMSIFNSSANAYSYSTTNKMHLLSQIIYSCKTLYMFRTVFPSIIRSSRLHIQQRYMSKSSCYLLLSGMRWYCSSISSPLAAGAVDIYRCCTRSFELLMMDGKTVRNM